MDSDGYFREKAREIMATRERTAQALRALGFTLPDSQANFLFVAHPKVAGETLYRKCKEKGVLIRHFSDPAIAAYNRVTIGAPAEMEILKEKLTAALPNYDHIWSGELDGTLSVYIGDGVLGAAVQRLE